jgi:hypothetical protein
MIDDLHGNFPSLGAVEWATGGRVECFDELIFPESVLCPFSLERQLRGLATALRDRDELTGMTARPIDDPPRNATTPELEVSRGLGEGRIDDGIIDDDVSHECVSKSFLD